MLHQKNDHHVFISMKISFLLLLFALCNNAQTNIQNSKPENGFAVIELFTSEGCSSCPPADKLASKINEDYAGKNVLVLAYHVDYWDRLGWNDRFSSAANTERQHFYASILKWNSIYTPQAVVNGTTEFVGSEKSKMIRAIENSNLPNKKIGLTATSVADNKVIVNYKADEKNKDENILIALVEKEAFTEVKRGENGGMKLSHINIVRRFQILKTNQGSVAFTVSAKVKNDYFIAALVQNEKTGIIYSYRVSGIL